VSLDRVRDTWEGLGRIDPMWAILADPQKRGNLWDAKEFYENGELEIDALMRALDERSLSVARQRCMDFGCGVGRLTQALARRFDLVDGVDVADSMIERAKARNQYGDRCRYHVNVRDDLGLFGDDVFDLVYSNIVLQHMEPDLAARYIGEFVRVLKPGGLAIFQIPSGLLSPSRLADGSHAARLVIEGPLRPVEMKSGDRVVISLRVSNDSVFPWPSSATVNVGNHWLDRQGTVIVLDDGRTPLGRALEPKEELTLGVVVNAPDRPGRYILEVDLVEEGVAWFSDRGSRTSRVDVEVKRLPAWARGSNRLQRTLKRFKTGPVGSIDPDAPFEMHAVPKERVVAVVTGAGGRIVDIERFDVSGPGWESYRYYATKSVSADT
jgi:SAM-dependent methyltransferase